MMGNWAAIGEESRWRLLLVGLPLATGGALLLYVLAGWSLLAALGVTAMVTAATAVYGWQRLGPFARAWARRRVLAGIVAGVVATIGYDVVRLALVRFGGFTFWPFDIFGVFGRALLGDVADPLLLRAAGVSYHLANGICFGIAYALVWGRRGVWTGLAWAMGLEALMVGIYPGWLKIDTLLGEFLSVSLFGHITYGLLLGSVARRLLRTPPRMSSTAGDAGQVL